MKSRSRHLMIIISFTILLVSVSWTYFSISSRSRNEPMQSVTLSLIPDYQIVTGADLYLWPKGTVLEQGRAAYFYAANPKVTVSYAIKIDGMEQGSIQGSMKSQVFIQSVDDKSEIYWSYKLKESSEKDFTLTDFYQTSGIVLDVPSAYNRIILINEELLFQNGIFQMVVESDITLNGLVNNIPIEKSILHTLPINLLQTSFTLPKSEELITEVSLVETATSPSLPASVFDVILENLIPFSISLLLLILLIILIMLNERQKPRAAKEHLRFKEWITEGSVEVKDRLSIHIFTLEGLVDVAIDLDKRVIYDAKVNRYYVLAEDIVYVYDVERNHALLENKQQLGKLLLNLGLLTPEQLEIGLYHQKKIGSRLGESLIALGFLDETTLYSTLAAQNNIDYYELNPKTKLLDTTWLDNLTIHQARAMMAIPIGLSSDQSMVIACSEASRAGIKDTLEGIFGKKVYLVSSKPSAIYEILESIEKMEKDKVNILAPKDVKNEPFERLDEEERKQFLASYYRGNLQQELFLKALGLLDLSIMSQLPDKDILKWLTGKNLISGDMSNLVRGLSIAINSMDWSDRHEKKSPGLLDLLFHSNYITEETKNWLLRELDLQSLCVSDLLRKNLIASEETLEHSNLILKALESLLIY